MVIRHSNSSSVSGRFRAEDDKVFTGTSKLNEELALRLGEAQVIGLPDIMGFHNAIQVLQLTRLAEPDANQPQDDGPASAWWGLANRRADWRRAVLSVL